MQLELAQIGEPRQVINAGNAIVRHIHVLQELQADGNVKHVGEAVAAGMDGDQVLQCVQGRQSCVKGCSGM